MVEVIPAWQHLIIMVIAVGIVVFSILVVASGVARSLYNDGERGGDDV